MDILIYRDSACRAYHTALTAAHAGGLRKRTAEGCADAHLASSVDKVYYAQALYFRACPYAVSAEDTFIRVVDYARRTVVQRQHRFVVLEPHIVDSQLVCKFKQDAGTVGPACGTVGAVGSQQQFQYHLSVVLELRGVGVDHHAVFWFFRARSENLASIVFNYAHPARSVGGKLRMIAEGRKLDTGISYDGQHILFIFKRDSPVVYGHVFHFSVLLLPFNMYSAESTGTLACSALDTSGVVDDIRFFDLA